MLRDRSDHVSLWLVPEEYDAKSSPKFSNARQRGHRDCPLPSLPSVSSIRPRPTPMSQALVPGSRPTLSSHDPSLLGHLPFSMPAILRASISQYYWYLCVRLGTSGPTSFDCPSLLALVCLYFPTSACSAHLARVPNSLVPFTLLPLPRFRTCQEGRLVFTWLSVNAPVPNRNWTPHFDPTLDSLRAPGPEQSEHGRTHGGS